MSVNVRLNIREFVILPFLLVYLIRICRITESQFIIKKSIRSLSVLYGFTDGFYGRKTRE